MDSFLWGACPRNDLAIEVAKRRVGRIPGSSSSPIRRVIEARSSDVVLGKESCSEEGLSSRNQSFLQRFGCGITSVGQTWSGSGSWNGDTSGLSSSSSMVTGSARLLGLSGNVPGKCLLSFELLSDVGSSSEDGSVVVSRDHSVWVEKAVFLEVPEAGVVAE